MAQNFSRPEAERDISFGRRKIKRRGSSGKLMTARSEKVDMSGVIKLLSGATRTPNSGRAVEIQRMSSISAFIRPPLEVLTASVNPSGSTSRTYCSLGTFSAKEISLCSSQRRQASACRSFRARRDGERLTYLVAPWLLYPWHRGGPTHFEFRTSKLCEVGADPLEKVGLAAAPQCRRGTEEGTASDLAVFRLDTCSGAGSVSVGR